MLFSILVPAGRLVGFTRLASYGLGFGLLTGGRWQAAEQRRGMARRHELVAGGTSLDFVLFAPAGDGSQACGGSAFRWRNLEALERTFWSFAWMDWPRQRAAPVWQGEFSGPAHRFHERPKQGIRRPFFRGKTQVGANAGNVVDKAGG